MTDNADPDDFHYALLDPDIPINEVPKGRNWVSFDAENIDTLDVAAWANTSRNSLGRPSERTARHRGCSRTT